MERSSPSVEATCTWALLPDFLAPASEVEDRSSSRLEVLAGGHELLACRAG